MVAQSMTTIALNAPAVECDVALQLAIDAKQAPTYFCAGELANACCSACLSNLLKFVYFLLLSYCSSNWLNLC